MRHHMYNPDFKFVVEPEHFDKYTDREFLQLMLIAPDNISPRRITSIVVVMPWTMYGIPEP